MDVFLECLVKKKKTAKDYAIIALIILATALLSVILFFLSFLLSSLSMLIVLLIAGVIYGAWYLISRMRLEYEYTVTNGIMDVDKIMSQRTRKRLVTVRLKDAEVFAPYNGRQKHTFETRQVSKTIDASVNKDEKETYCLIVNHSKHGLIKLIFTPDERVISSAKLVNPRNVFTD